MRNKAYSPIHQPRTQHEGWCQTGQWDESYSILSASAGPVHMAYAHFVMPMCEVAAEYERATSTPHVPERCAGGAAVWGYMTTADSDSHPVGRFDQKLAAQRLFPSLQLKSQH
jgi:hypothetical protein